MPDGLSSAGAVKDQSRSAPLNMSTYISGLITQQNPMSGGAVPYIQQKYYSASRYDRLLGGRNCELSVRLSMVRSPGSSLYNSKTFSRPNRWCSFKPIVNGVEKIHVMTDTAGNVFDGTGPNTQLNIWNKSVGSGKTQFQPVGNELFWGNGIDLKKWVLSELIWKPDTLYDGDATSDEALGDFIIDPNGNIQQAVGGFTLLISNVSITDDVLTLTLDTSQLADPSGTPTGVAAAIGGTLPAGNHFIRISAVDPTGNVTEAGNESAAVATTGTTSQIVWSWPAVAGAVGYRIYVASVAGTEATYFTSVTNSFTQTAPTSVAAGTPPIVNSTSIDVPDNLFLMVGVELELDGLLTATFLNGQTVTIASVVPGGQASNLITATFAHADYASTADQGTAVSGSGITGNTQPASWATVLWDVTQDAGAQWINRGNYVQNWGIATPASAPTIFQSVAPTLYPAWQPDTGYWPSRCVTSTYVSGIFLLTTPGMTGAIEPTWDESSFGATTADGTAEWTYKGILAGWTAATAFPKDSYTTFNNGGNYYVYVSQNPGVSGASQTWATGAGTIIQDGSIVWICTGKLLDYGQNIVSPSHNVSSSDKIVDSNGYIQQVQDPPGNMLGFSSGSTPPTWGSTGGLTTETLVATITSYVEFGDIVVSAVNSFPDFGQTVVITGLTVFTALNGSWMLERTTRTTFIIIAPSPGLTPVADSGKATVQEANMWLNIGPYAPVSTAPRFYAYAYKNSVTKHVGSVSRQSAAISLLGGNVANVQGFGSPDPQVDTIVIYQTTEGGSTLLEADEIKNPGGGIPWTYTDQIPDTGLNFEIPAAINGTNNPPPPGFLPSAYHLGRIWGFVGNKLIWSGGPDTLTGSGNEAFPPNNYFEMPETLTKCRATSIGLLIYGTANIYIETGLGTPDSPFIPPPTFQEGVGLLSYDAECVNGSTTYMMTSAGRVISLDPGAGEVEVGFFIGNLFDSDFDPSLSYLTFHEGSSEDMALYVADGSTGFYRMGILGAPEAGNIWSPFREIVGGCGAIQSVEVNVGRKPKKLLIGANVSGPILQRDYAVYSDNGDAYPMWLLIGSILLCQPGTEAEVEFVTLDSLLIGTRPSVGLLLGELSGYAATPPFVTLQANGRDLPLLPAPKTLYSDRYDMAQNQNQQSCRHLQMRIDWAVEAVANELLTHTIYGTLRPEP